MTDLRALVCLLGWTTLACAAERPTLPMTPPTQPGVSVRTQAAGPSIAVVAVDAPAQARDFGWHEIEVTSEPLEVVVGHPPDARTPRSPLRARAGLQMVVNAPARHSAASTLVHVTVLMDRSAGRRPEPRYGPAAGAAVYHHDQLVGRTDEHGVLVFRTREDRYVLQAVHGRGGARRKVSDPYELLPPAPSPRGDPRLVVMLERGADGVRLRGTVLTSSPDAPLTVTVTAPNGHAVRSQPIQTDAAGAAWFDLVPPPSLSFGTYVVTAETSERTLETRLSVDPRTIRIETVLPSDGAEHVRVRLRDEAGQLLPISSACAQLVVQTRQGDYHRDNQFPTTPERPDECETFLDVNMSRFTELVFRATDDTGRRGRYSHVLWPTEATASVQALVATDRARHAPGDVVQVTSRVLEGARPLANAAVQLETPAGTLDARTDTHGVAQWRFNAPEVVTYSRLDCLPGWIPIATPIGTYLPPVEGPRGDVPVPAEPVPILTVRHEGRVIGRHSFGLSEQPMRVSVRGTRRGVRCVELDRVGLPPACDLEGVDPGAIVDLSMELASDVRPREDVLHVDVTDGSGAIVHSQLVPFDGQRAEVRLAAPATGPMRVSLYALAERYGELGFVTEGLELRVASEPMAVEVRRSGGRAELRMRDLAGPVLVRGHVRPTRRRIHREPRWPYLARTWGLAYETNTCWYRQSCWGPSINMPESQVGPYRFGWYPGVSGELAVWRRHPRLPLHDRTATLEDPLPSDEGWAVVVRPTDGEARLAVPVPDEVEDGSVVLTVTTQEGQVRTVHVDL